MYSMYVCMYVCGETLTASLYIYIFMHACMYVCGETLTASLYIFMRACMYVWWALIKGENYATFM